MKDGNHHEVSYYRPFIRPSFFGFTTTTPEIDNRAAHTNRVRQLMVQHLNLNENWLSDRTLMDALLPKCSGLSTKFLEKLFPNPYFLIPFENEPPNIPLCLQVFDRAVTWYQGPGQHVTPKSAEDLIEKAGTMCDNWSDAEFMQKLNDVLNRQPPE
ncbi:MAG: hypothetical protein H6925_04610 [Holosporaceae bacterium]|nr:MAG: hypothetical protein H6925_04610 [Holosporaceae bacterium]